MRKTETKTQLSAEGLTQEAIDFFNSVMSEFNTIEHGGKFKEIARHQPDDYHEEKYSGGTSERYKVYDLGREDGYVLKVTWENDSYGNEEHVTSLQFVKGTTKTVTVYE